MKNLNTISLAIIAIVAVSLFLSFRTPSPQPSTVKWLQITVVESVIPGGVGRSRLITIDDQGNTSEVKINNFFSIAGINFGNIRENDQTVTNTIQELSNQGWELKHVTSGVFSGNQNNTNGIFMTRYMFSKSE
jgi:hypothetical protein